MTSALAEHPRQRIALRPLALPAEHGGWGLLLEPIVLALLVAPSVGGLLISVGTLAVFLIRHPLRLAAHDWLHRRYPRTAVCEATVAAYAAVACLVFAGAWRVASARPLLALASAIPFALANLIYDLRKRSRTLVAELAGAIAPTAAAAAIALAGGRSGTIAFALTLLAITRSVPAVLYVRSTLRSESRMAMLLAHVVAIAVAVSLWSAGAAPLLAIVAMLLLFARALPKVPDLRPRTIGFREIGWGAAFVALIALGY